MKKGLQILMAGILAFTFLSGCFGKSGSHESVVYDDMKEAFEKSGLFSANVGLFSKTVTGDSVSYGECGSGVVIEQKEGVCYALTAAHVVSHENAQILVFTVNTEMKSEEIPGLDQMKVLSEETYESMIPAEVVFVSTRDDVAVVRFTCDEGLSTAQLTDEDPANGDRIMCVGNPQSDWFAVSYGKITSGMMKFGETTGFPSNVMKHSAYINMGSSGGAAFNEQMKVAGITPGASLTPGEGNFIYGVMIPTDEIRACLQEWDRGQ